MKAISYAVAILITCGAAFFSYNHSQKFSKLETERVSTNKENKQVTADADASDKVSATLSDQLAKGKERRDLLEQSVSSLKSEGTGLNSDLEKLDADTKAQEVEFAQLQKTLEEVNEIVKTLGTEVTLENLPDTIAGIVKDVEDKKTKLSELETLVAGADKTLASSRAEQDRLAQRMIQRNSRIARNSMEAVVTAVNQEWGFLVIGAGSNSGFTPQTALLVERDGRKIGRVRPSAIEQTQTIAEIDLPSMASGVRIQPGDRVILATPTTN